MISDFYTSIKSIAGRLSREAVLWYSVFIVFGFSLFLIAYDAVIFWRYYQIAVEPSQPEVFQKIEISHSDLQKALEIIKKREAAP